MSILDIDENVDWEPVNFKNVPKHVCVGCGLGAFSGDIKFNANMMHDTGVKQCGPVVEVKKFPDSVEVVVDSKKWRVAVDGFGFMMRKVSGRGKVWETVSDWNL